MFRSPLKLLTTLVLSAAAGQAAHAASSADQLKMLRGSTRPIVILSDSRDDPRVAKQISDPDHAQPELDSRNIKVLQEARPGSRLRRTLGVARRGFAVVLVGKDGSVKKVWHDPVAPNKIFTVIDSMPMRRNEMRG